MGDSGDLWRLHKEHADRKKQVRMRKNREDSANPPAGVTVVTLTATHWRVMCDDRVLDFWPTTNRVRSVRGSSLAHDGWARKGLADVYVLITAVERQETYHG